jgi:calcium-dependent protein kinase
MDREGAKNSGFLKISGFINSGGSQGQSSKHSLANQIQEQIAKENKSNAASISNTYTNRAKKQAPKLKRNSDISDYDDDFLMDDSENTEFPDFFTKALNKKNIAESTGASMKSKLFDLSGVKKLESRLNEQDLIGKTEGKVEDQYSFLQPPLGYGSFGVVYKVIHKNTGVVRAVKQIKRQMFDQVPGGMYADEEDHLKSYLNDFEVLKTLKHPNIIQVKEYFISETYVSIVSEFCSGGELFDRIILNGKFSEEEAANLISQVLSAVSYCHQKQLVHCDIKPENIVYQDQVSDVIKLIDFGNCAFVTNGKLKNKFGTVYYIAPEVLEGSYDQKCDIWSCGVLLYILLSGKPPFGGQTDQDILKKVEKGEYSFNRPGWESISAEAKNLISLMLTKKPDSRISASDALQHTWLKMRLSSTATGSHKVPRDSVTALRAFRSKCRLQQTILYFLMMTVATKEEYDEMTGEFMALDTDFDGKISISDIRQACQKIGKSEAQANKIAQSVLEQNDQDNKGHIDYIDFAKAYFASMKYLSEEKLQKAFRMIDTKNDGKLTIDEIKAIFKNGAFNEFDDDFSEKFIQNAGLGESGKEITFEEFKDWMELLSRTDQISQSFSQKTRKP